MLLGENGGPIGFANISVFEMLYDEKGELYVPIYYDFPLGDGDSIDKNSALVKPFNNILKEGKPNGKIAFVFYMQDEKYYVLGSFVNTGRRILFFPSSRTIRVTHTPYGEDLNSKCHNIDHITLENNLTEWHVTLIEKAISEIRYGSLRTKSLQDNICLWCVIGVKDVSKLELMPRTQEYRLKGANNEDTKRRFKEFINSREKSVFPIIEVKTNSNPPFFLNFEIFLSSQRITHLLLPKPIFIIPPPLSTLNMKATISRIVDVDLGDFAGSIVIRSSKPNGSIKDDIAIVAGNEFDTSKITDLTE